MTMHIAIISGTNVLESSEGSTLTVKRPVNVQKLDENMYKKKKL